MKDKDDNLKSFNNGYAIKVLSKDKELIDQIAELFYKTAATEDLINTNNNPQVIEVLSEKYADYFAQCETKKNILKRNIIGDDDFFITDYSISFTSYTVLFYSNFYSINSSEFESRMRKIENSYKYN